MGSNDGGIETRLGEGEPATHKYNRIVWYDASLVTIFGYKISQSALFIVELE
jgi:hypothetical protein